MKGAKSAEAAEWWGPSSTVQRSVLEAAVVIEVVGTEDEEVVEALGLSMRDVDILRLAIERRLARDRA